MKSILIFSTTFLALMAVALACPTMNAQTVDELYNEIPSLDAQLQTCPITLPNNLKLLMSSGNLGVNVVKNDGTTVSYTIVLFNGEIVNMNQGTSSSRFTATIGEDNFNTILTTPSAQRASVVFSQYQQKKITTSSRNILMRGKLGIARAAVNLFGSRISKSLTPPPQTYPKPDNCDETWIPGHRQYAQNKETWDRYSADSDGACQSNNPVSCKFNIQLSIEGRPYYLCWYDN